MHAREPRLPKYRLHKATGQAVVTIGGRDLYLGRHGSSESRAEYDRRIAEWLTTGRRSLAPGSDLTVAELALAYLKHADVYYRKNGQPTSEVKNIARAIKPLRELYGDILAAEFSPLKLKTVRERMIESGLCRNEVNRRCRILCRIYRWAAAEELVPVTVPQALGTVAGLRAGRTTVRESKPIGPVHEAHVAAIEPDVPPPVWAMIRLQLLTGMRPGEVVSMRMADLDMSGETWCYTPESHKTEHRGRSRRIFIGPEGQAVLLPWFRAERSEYLFCPAESEAARRVARRNPRKVRARRPHKRRPQWIPGPRYSVGSYALAIRSGIARANRRIRLEGGREVPHWAPNQLRHAAATRLRREFGLDVARTVLGHSSPVMTAVYAEADWEKAAKAMHRIG
jgi:integrase